MHLGGGGGGVNNVTIHYYSIVPQGCRKIYSWLFRHKCPKEEKKNQISRWFSKFCKESGHPIPMKIIGNWEFKHTALQTSTLALSKLLFLHVGTQVLLKCIKPVSTCPAILSLSGQHPLLLEKVQRTLKWAVEPNNKTWFSKHKPLRPWVMAWDTDLYCSYQHLYKSLLIGCSFYVQKCLIVFKKNLFIYFLILNSCSSKFQR